MIYSDRSDLSKELLKLRKKGKKIVFTNGVFDIIHSGHVEYLKAAKELGDVLVIGVNTDDSVRALKGPQRPINKLDERLFVLDALKPVNFVVSFSESTPIELIKVLKPDIHVKGGDYTEDQLPEAKIVKEYGGTVKIIPFKNGFSVTGLIKKIKTTSK
ncbi:D-glycero-beta-D-manno-heptose 1-phosphate adenylyltransferase [Candidatus Micrarchaeota archaeon]|nr:D-glycero-beta-D-manno-heptose 1-phosphate adenylyltransferase [Candidatus Micrarchaeota archaeon]